MVSCRCQSSGLTTVMSRTVDWRFQPHRGGELLATDAVGIFGQRAHVVGRIEREGGRMLAQALESRQRRVGTARTQQVPDEGAAERVDASGRTPADDLPEDMPRVARRGFTVQVAQPLRQWPRG